MRHLALTACLLALLTTSVYAGGVNLTWGTGCWQDASATLQTFACDANTGSSTFTTSFVLDRDIPRFGALIGIVDLQSASSLLPDWWQLSDQNPPGCRTGALSILADFLLAPGGCADPWLGLAAGGAGAWHTAVTPPPPPGEVPPPNRARLKVGLVLPDPNPLVAAREYYAFSARIDDAQTVGPGSCAGCEVPAAIVLNMIEAQGVDYTTFQVVQRAQLTTPLANTCIYWQAPTGGLCGATPARNQTWGQVKSLYR